jgi:hypothetical protein
MPGVVIGAGASDMSSAAKAGEHASMPASASVVVTTDGTPAVWSRCGCMFLSIVESAHPAKAIASKESA